MPEVRRAIRTRSAATCRAVLELLDLRVDRVERLEIRLRDLVDEAMDELAARPPGRRPGGAPPGRTARRRPRRLAHRDDDSRGRDEIDLLIARRDPRRAEGAADENAEHVRAVALEQRPRLAAVLRIGASASTTSGSTWTGSARGPPRETGRRGRASVRSQPARLVSGRGRSRYAVTAVTSGWCRCSSSQRCASRAAIVPDPAAVTACRYV